MGHLHSVLLHSAKGCARLAHHNLRAFAPLRYASNGRRNRRAAPRTPPPSNSFKTLSRSMQQPPLPLHKPMLLVPMPTR